MFGENLYKLLHAQKISGKELSLSTGISQSTISKFLSNHQEPKYSQIIAIAKVLHIPPDIFMSVVNPAHEVNQPFINENCMIRELFSDENSHLHISTLYAFKQFIMEIPVINDEDIFVVVILEGGTESKLGTLCTGDFRVAKGIEYRGLKVTVRKGTKSIALVMHESINEPVTSWSKIFYEFLASKKK